MDCSLQLIATQWTKSGTIHSIQRFDQSLVSLLSFEYRLKTMLQSQTTYQVSQDLIVDIKCSPLENKTVVLPEVTNEKQKLVSGNVCLIDNRL